MKSLPYAIALGLIYIKCIVAFVVKVVWSHTPVLKNKLQKFEEESNRVPYQNFWDVYGGRKHFFSILKILVGDLNKVAKLGFSAPNCTVAKVDGKECKLLDFTKGNRPLVLNFGSCTWPPFLVTFVKDFQTVAHNFDKVADFLTVYISEAHPTDDWRWNNNIEIQQHKNLIERCDAAKRLQESCSCTAPIVVDSMQNEANDAYGAWPERLYIIQQGKIVYEGGTGPYNYNLGEVEKWLEKYKTTL